MANPAIRIKRVYEPGSRADGRRYLVERLWPRGIKKEALSLDAWYRDVAPSHELREWFHHDPEKWKEFERRYRVELREHPEAWQPLLETAGEGVITLLFSARDTEHNNAVVLRSFLGGKMRHQTHHRNRPKR